MTTRRIFALMLTVTTTAIAQPPDPTKLSDFQKWQLSNRGGGTSYAEPDLHESLFRLTQFWEEQKQLPPKQQLAAVKRAKIGRVRNPMHEIGMMWNVECHYRRKPYGKTQLLLRYNDKLSRERHVSFLEQFIAQRELYGEQRGPLKTTP